MFYFFLKSIITFHESMRMWAYLEHMQA